MFDWVDKHKRWIQISLLVLIVPSFAFFGINYYFNEYGDSGAVAQVAGTKISPQEFESALRERQEQLRQMMKEKADPAMLDSNEVRNGVINALVEKRALLAHALNSGMTVPDAQVRKVITEIPYFKDESTGKFSQDRYAQVLKGQGMTPVMFEERVRQDMRIAQSRDSVTGSTILADAVVSQLGRIREQRREVSQWVVSPEHYVAKVTVADAEVKKHYDENQKDFRIPERVRVEFVALTPEVAGKSVTVTEQEIQEQYKKNEAQYRTPEERKASHILVTMAKDADATAQEQARKRAQDLLDEVRKNPKSFADVARKNSQDPGSAANGGDLGFFAQGAMDKAFDDAVFSMKEGEIRGPVQSQYGFHVVRLDAIKPGTVTPLEKVRGEIEAELKKPKLSKAFADVVSTFEETVYSQSDSLKPVAEALKLQIETSDWITRDGGGNPLLTKPALLGKIFSDDAIKNSRNTEAVEVSPNTLVSARVVEHRPASVLPFDDVKADVAQRLQVEKAAQLAIEQGKKTLESLRQGKTDANVTWSAPIEVSLQRPGDVLPEAAREVFGTAADKLPAYVGVAASKGRYVVYRISKVIDAPQLTADQKEELRKQLAQLAAQQQFDAYLQIVKAAAKVSVETARIEKSAQ
ncbi:MAG: SurA N-terminal domain-containing protein [Betaproteobacteria bacterium]|nr:SurA N-terminal domain-containing protein [Betaproteobacteria bacterium]